MVEVTFKTLSQIGEMLDIPYSTIYQWAIVQGMPYFRIGSAIYAEPEKVKEWIRSKEVKREQSQTTVQPDPESVPGGNYKRLFCDVPLWLWDAIQKDADANQISPATAAVHILKDGVSFGRLAYKIAKNMEVKDARD